MLNRKDFLEKLEKIIRLEVIIRQSKALSESINSRMEKLAKPINNEKPKLDTTFKSISIGFILSTIVTGVIFFFITGIIYTIIFHRSSTTFTSELIANIIVFISVLIPIGGTAAEISSVKSYNKNLREKNKSLESNYSSSYHKDLIRVRAEDNLKKELFVRHNEIADVSAYANACCHALYQESGLYYDYHTLEAVFKIYQYIDSGRCAGLQGPAGAYNLYENERRLDEVIRQLKNMDKHLSKISKGIMGIYHQFSETNKLLNSMSLGVDHLANEINLQSDSINQLADKIGGHNERLIGEISSIANHIENMEDRDFQRFLKNNDRHAYIKF